jgi:hypothetical protein
MATSTQVAAALQASTSDVPAERSASFLWTPVRRALAFVLGLRFFYSLLGAIFSPGLLLDPKLIQSNGLTDHLIDRASHPVMYALFGVWERFDTLWYINIARHGYDSPATTVFYPLYPALIRVVSFVLRSDLAAALVVSTAASFFLFWGALRLFELDLAPGVSWRAIVLWMAWPASFTFFAGYPDSLLCALVVWSIYFGRTDRWFAAGALGMLAGCTKALGCFAALPLVWIAWKRRDWRGVLAAAMCGVGVACFQGWLILSHFPSAVDTYQIYWRTTTVAPWTTLAEAINAVAHGGNFLVMLNLLVFMVAGVAALLPSVRFEYKLYAVAAMGLFLTKHTDPLLQSTTRYSLTVFAAFPGLASKLGAGLPYAAVLFAGAALNLLLFRVFLDWGLVV